jgi:quercetin dioxygenase-like cupin family protein
MSSTPLPTPGHQFNDGPLGTPTGLRAVSLGWPPYGRERCTAYSAEMAGKTGNVRKPVILEPGEGRPYEMGGMYAVFKADGTDTLSRYNVSEWWLDPHTLGPGAHSHDEDDIFYVIEGTLDFLVDDEWSTAPRGSFVLVPGGVTHTFRNSGDVRAGALNFGVPGGFEEMMPAIVEYFAEHPPGRA